MAFSGSELVKPNVPVLGILFERSHDAHSACVQMDLLGGKNQCEFRLSLSGSKTSTVEISAGCLLGH